MSLLFGPNLDQLLFCPGATIGNTVTFAGWFYPITVGEGHGGTLIWHENTTTDARPRIGMYWTTALQVQMFCDTSAVDVQAVTNTAVGALNTWLWVGMTWDLNLWGNRPTFYVRNGDNWQVWEGANVAWSNPTGSPLGGDGYNVRIGNNNRADQCFHGYIAETYVWRRILTAEQMRVIAFEGPATSQQDIHFWYNPNVPLIPYPGTTGAVTDISGNARPGLTLGSPVFTAFEPPPRAAVPTPGKPSGRFGPQIVV